VRWPVEREGGEGEAWALAAARAAAGHCGRSTGGRGVEDEAERQRTFFFLEGWDGKGESESSIYLLAQLRRRSRESKQKQ